MKELITFAVWLVVIMIGGWSMFFLINLITELALGTPQ